MTENNNDEFYLDPMAGSDFGEFYARMSQDNFDKLTGEQMTEFKFKITVKYHVVKSGYITKHELTTAATSHSAAQAVATICDILNTQTIQDKATITNMEIQCSVDHKV